MTPLTALLFATTACSGEQDHGHDHDHDGAHQAEVPADEPATPAEPATPEPDAITGAMGPWTVELEPSADRVQVVATDAQGDAVTPEGELHLALTAASGGTEMVTLRPDGAGWSGPATIADDGAYMAQLTGPAGSARLMWGKTATGHTMKTPEPAPDADENDHGGHDHGHDH